MSRLKDAYYKVIRPKLMKDFGYKNLMQTPRLTKIVVNMGVGQAAQDGKKMTAAVDELTLITGQKPVVTKLVCQLLPLSYARVCLLAVR